MKTLVINLKDATERRAQMTSISNSHKYLNIDFIEAVDCRKTLKNELEKKFNSLKFQQEYFRNPQNGEIGCTLSHQICYKKLLDSNEKSILILEDDILIKKDFQHIIKDIEEFLNTDEPRIILLSGWFWYTKKKFFSKNQSIGKVFDAYLTHAYALNKEAANLMLDSKPWYLADSWDIFRRRGVKIYGLIPHLIDQDWENIPSSIGKITERHNISKFIIWLKVKKKTIPQHFLKIIGKFESKD